MTLHKDIIRAFNIGIITCIAILIIITGAISVFVIKNSVDEILFEKAVTRAEALTREVATIVTMGGDVDELQCFVDREAESADILYAIIIDDTVTAIAHSERYTVGWTYMDSYTQEAIDSQELRTTMWYSENLHEWARDITMPVMVDGEYLFSLSVGIVPDMGTNQVVHNLLKNYILMCILGIIILSIIITRLSRIYIAPIVESAKNIQEEYSKVAQTANQRNAAYEIVSNINSIVSDIEKKLGRADVNELGKATIIEIENSKEEPLLKIKLTTETLQETQNLEKLEKESMKYNL